jgi:hypothetical protein
MILNFSSLFAASSLIQTFLLVAVLRVQGVVPLLCSKHRYARLKEGNPLPS